MDVMRGGAGPDAMFGGTGDDFMDGGPRHGPDLFVGDGLSSDTADYRLRAERVEVTLPPMFVPPGVAGEVTTLDGDRLQQISNVLGGSGADRLIGNNGPNELRGGRGDDKLDGRGGDDVLRGDGGRDVIGALRPFPSGVCTFVLGQGQVCTLDYFVANPAPDGRDTMLGGPDGDQISARDLAPDERIDCGTGTDGRAATRSTRPRPAASRRSRARTPWGNGARRVPQRAPGSLHRPGARARSRASARGSGRSSTERLLALEPVMLVEPPPEHAALPRRAVDPSSTQRRSMMPSSRSRACGSTPNRSSPSCASGSRRRSTSSVTGTSPTRASTPASRPSRAPAWRLSSAPENDI